MPRYEYICEGGHEFEAKAGFEDAKISCPVVVGGCQGRHKVNPKHQHTLAVCGQIATRKGVQKISGVIFSGGGFTRSST